MTKPWSASPDYWLTKLCLVTYLTLANAGIISLDCD